MEVAMSPVVSKANVLKVDRLKAVSSEVRLEDDILEAKVILN